MDWLVDGTTAAIVKRLSESGAGAGESSVRSKVWGSVRGGDTGLNGGVDPDCSLESCVLELSADDVECGGMTRRTAAGSMTPDGGRGVSMIGTGESDGTGPV